MNQVMKTFVSRSGRHLWRQNDLGRCAARCNASSPHFRWASSVAGEDAVDIKKTRNIGIIAHIDAVSIGVLQFFLS